MRLSNCCTNNILRIKPNIFPLATIFAFLFSSPSLADQAESFAQPEEYPRFRKTFSEAYWFYEAPASFRAPDYAPDGARVTVNEFRARTGFPFYRDQSFLATVGARVQWDQFFFSGIPFENIDTWNIGIPLFVSWKIDESWRIAAGFTPGIYSDLERISWKDFGAAGNLFAAYSWAPGQSVSGGLVYSRIFGEERLFPALGLVLHPGKDWELRLIFPQPAIRYSPVPGFNLVAGMTPAGGQWNITNPIDEDGAECDFTFKGYRAGVGVELALGRHLVLSLDGGFSFERDYEVENENEDILDTRANETFGFRVGLLLVR